MRWPKLCRALEHVVDRHGPVDGRTRLLKLVYLADRRWSQIHGQPYTEANYYRWNHGPFAREILQALDWLDGVEIVERAIQAPGNVLYQYESGERTRLARVALDEEFRSYLDEEATRWKNAPLQALLDHVYAAPDFEQAAFGDKLLAQG